MNTSTPSFLVTDKRLLPGYAVLYAVAASYEMCKLLAFDAYTALGSEPLRLTYLYAYINHPEHAGS
jgi:hypothetical protein